MKKKIICIVGPTASGKTGLGVLLAKKFSGEIISADSRQVYRGLNVGTGKDRQEYGKIKCHLIDIVDPEEKFTLFDWLELARRIIDNIFSRGKTPIVVGGTGLYVQALIEGFKLSQKPKIKNQNGNLKCRIYKREELEKKSLRELQNIYLRFRTIDSRLDQNNPHRLIRAIERAQNKQTPTKIRPDFEVLQIGIFLPRQILYEKIGRRVDQRFENEGMLEEMAGLLANGISPQWLKSLGLEYGIISNYINQKIKINPPAGGQNDKEKIKNLYQKVKNEEEFKKMKQELKYKIHAFARRQLTWFRRFPEIKWIETPEEALTIVGNYLKK